MNGGNSVRARVSDVRLVGIRKSFGDNVIVKGVDLDVKPGAVALAVASALPEKNLQGGRHAPA